MAAKFSYAALDIAFIVPREPVSISSILLHCRQNLAGYKVPQRVIVLEEMPRNTSGKVVRATLRKLTAASG